MDQFDIHIARNNTPNRSKAISDLIREEMTRQQWITGKEVAGTITLVYDHHKRELTPKLTAIQHDIHRVIISTQHIHLDHDNCLEVLILRGKPERMGDLLEKLRAVKGIKHCSLSMATTGQNL